MKALLIQDLLLLKTKKKLLVLVMFKKSCLVSESLVCLPHMDKLCKCPPTRYCLRYRYTLDELPSMLGRLKDRAECYEKWHGKVKLALEATDEKKVGM